MLFFVVEVLVEVDVFFVEILLAATPEESASWATAACDCDCDCPCLCCCWDRTVGPVENSVERLEDSDGLRPKENVKPFIEAPALVLPKGRKGMAIKIFCLFVCCVALRVLVSF